jgi:hypothetical protein
MYKFYVGKICKECLRKIGVKRSANYRKVNYTEYRRKGREASTKYYSKIKKILFAGYGDRCACCGEIEPKFLSIDHVNNDGYKERGHRHKLNSDSYGINLYKKIIGLNFPSQYQLLCMNCNFGKRMNNGVCPHNESKKGLTTIPINGSTHECGEAHCSEVSSDDDIVYSNEKSLAA